MGTNYYVDDDPTCNNPAHTKVLHIGKSSRGWKFGFHAIPDHQPPLTSWAAWREFLAVRPIRDEYGQRLTFAAFTRVVEDRATASGTTRPICRVEPTLAEIQRGYGGRYIRSDKNFHDDDGFDFYDGDFS